MKRPFVLLLCAVLIPAASLAQTQIVEVHIYHDGHSGAVGSQFMLDLGYSAVWVGDSWSVPVSIGTSVSGVSLDYGGCTSAPTYLGKVTIFVNNDENLCTDLQIVPDPSSPGGRVYYVDCSYEIWYPSPNWFRLDYDPCRVNSPGGPQPPDGAVGVALNPTLFWTWEGNTNCPGGLGIEHFEIYLGAAGGNLELVGYYMDPAGVDAPHLSVGPLAPLTQYEWRVKVIDEFWNCPGLNWAWSPIYSFTTEPNVPVKKTSWGRIKNLYR